MGNWNRRYYPRKKCRYDQYEEPESSSAGPYDTHSYSSGTTYSGVDFQKVQSWEIDYCNSLKVPWKKILASKRYIHYYPTVLNWDDSAGKEAFQNAKQRYWEMINGFACDNTLPNPDMFIERIDWNPYLDPELMTELEHLYFNPDRVDRIENLEIVNEAVGCTQAQEDMNQSTSNPWEKDHAQSSQKLKDALKGWRQNHDPWEQNDNQLIDSSKDNAWRNGNESWGQSSWQDDTQRYPQAGTGQEEGWGHSGNNTWSCGNVNNQELRNFSGYSRYSWENNHSTFSQERGWRDKGNISQLNSKESYQGKDPNNWNPRRFPSGGECLFRGGCQKRESSLQHMQKYKSSRYQ